jgi:aspartate dehydrogenase
MLELMSPRTAASQSMPETHELAVGIAGLGAIGSEVAHWLVGRAPPGLHLAAAAGRDLDETSRRLVELGHPQARAVPLDALPGACDVLVECLAPEAAAVLLDGVVDGGGTVVTVSVAALLATPALLDRARRAGTRLIVPSGAVAGLDMLRAAAIGRIRSVRLRTRKPPAGLDAAGDGPVRVFAGNALEACRAFPRNVNVAATLSLAGIGGARTEVEIWSDPALARNVHEIEIDADDTLLRMTIENRPSAANPRSSAITAHSVCAALAALLDPVRIGG